MTGRTLLRRTNPISMILLIGTILFFQIPQTGWANTEREEKLQSEITNKYKAGLYKEALPFAAELLEFKIKIHGPDHLDVASTLNNIGDIFYKINNYSDAEINYLRALNIFKKILGTNHSHVAATLHNLGDVYRKTDVFSRAEQFYQVAIRIREKTLGRDHKSVATSLNNLAELYKNHELYEKAEPLYQRSLEIFEGVYETGHAHIGIAVHNLADLYRVQEAYAKALPLYQRLLTITQKTHATDDPKLVALQNIVTELGKTHGSVAKLDTEMGETTIPEDDKQIDAKEESLDRSEKTTAQNNETPTQERSSGVQEEDIIPLNNPDPAVEETDPEKLNKDQNEETVAIFPQDSATGFEDFSSAPRRDAFNETTLTSNIPLNAFSEIGMSIESSNDDIQEETLTSEQQELSFKP